ncbi:ABC transporter transmembrane domain-containing protein [Sunxiuqinia elliptica]|uniref:ABC-type multidrug transport system fused ATPase/permease subunit n=1 Tax=Sunxiuqinia elliptica TaxID=655355 RepID=A0A4V3BYM5_9BACT|nr:ABC transporter ATP-binding protein [Sunxiuqinia elliptica]TDO03199.1 ABC-type multidrug transport system fused ATPase/permease subunit [Sunxiuqinia elliptica]TDO59396.1 ABC-type multidrug transport system fused ATPase/permease subunit [Sunxiuqinia elliptica]
MERLKGKWLLLFKFIKGNRALVTVTLISGLVYNIFTLLIPIGIGRFYEFNFDITSQRLKLLESLSFLNSGSFTIFLLFFILVVILRFIFEYINRYLISIIGESFAKNLREQLFEHQLQISTSIYDQKGIGKYLLRYSGDLKSIQDYITKGLFKYTQDLILILFLLATISFIDIHVGAISTVLILLANILLGFINKALYTISVSRRNQRSGLLTFVNTRLRAMASIKAFNKYYIEQKRYAKRSERLYQTGKKYQAVANLIFSVIPAFTYLMIALLMWYVYHVKTTMGDTFNQTSFLILILLVISFLPILRRTLRVSIVWKLGSISFEKLLNIFSFEAENTLPSPKIDLADKAISFNDVSFNYPSSNNLVFDKLNISFSPGGITAVIGGAGTGKTTLLNLILKVYQPVSGEIHYGTHRHNELSEKTIRRNIVVISDDFPLYGKSVYEAIVYSRKEKMVKRATKLLNELQQFEDAKNKLQLQDSIGDLGKSLTSGQKRILMYARALLSNKPWLLIDEPLKGLKQETSSLIRDKLNLLSTNKSIIVFDSEVPGGLLVGQVYSQKDNTFTKK